MEAQEIINDLNKEDLCRDLAKAVHQIDNPDNEKADVWICGFHPAPTSAKTKCKECGKVCYYDPERTITECLKKKHRKICTDCALNNPKYSECLNPIERMILEGTK